MAKIRCPFCHEYIDEYAYAAHEARHAARRSDGQQNDYATLPADQRASGNLAGVPRVYMHVTCRESTVMPEEIVRSYLQDPHLYNADATYCCGCETHVPFSECVWAETGENVQLYMNKLRAAKPKAKGCWASLMQASLIVAAIVCSIIWLCR
jgi:hypothetical protein